MRQRRIVGEVTLVEMVETLLKVNVVEEKELEEVEEEEEVGVRNTPSVMVEVIRWTS